MDNLDTLTSRRNTLQSLYIPRAETSGIMAEVAEMDKDDHYYTRVTSAGGVFPLGSGNAWTLVAR